MKAVLRSALTVVTCIACFGVTACFGQSSSMKLLDHLRGRWHMTGTVMKQPVQYTAEGTWMLDGQFLAFHMVDAAVPPTYEATLYIGIDSSRNEYVAHWLDTFGGAGARVVGLGPLSGKSIELVYPYAEGAFRNSFAFDPALDRWTLLIQAQDSTGHWSDFANYMIARQR